MTIRNVFSREAEIQVRVLQLMARQSSNLNFQTPVQWSQSYRPCLAPGKQCGWAMFANTLCISNVPAAMVLAQPNLAMSAALTLPEAFWLVGRWYFLWDHFAYLAQLKSHILAFAYCSPVLLQWIALASWWTSVNPCWGYCPSPVPLDVLILPLALLLLPHRWACFAASGQAWPDLYVFHLAIPYLAGSLVPVPVGTFLPRAFATLGTIFYIPWPFIAFSTLLGKAHPKHSIASRLWLAFLSPPGCLLIPADSPPLSCVMCFSDHTNWIWLTRGLLRIFRTITWDVSYVWWLLLKIIFSVLFRYCPPSTIMYLLSA